MTRCYSGPMLERLGIKGRHELVVFLSLILLVALAPTGKEASHPLVLGIYRTLIIVIVGCYAWSDRSRLPRLSPLFLGGVMALGTIMSSVVLLLLSVQHRSPPDVITTSRRRWFAASLITDSPT